MLYSFSNFHTREEIIHWIISLIFNIFLNCGFIESHRTHIIKRIVSCIEMNCTPKVRQKKSNFWGVFIMKLTYGDKVQIYELRK